MRIPFHPAIYPPAPALEIRLINPATRIHSAYYHAILDTGSDITLVPTKMLTALRLSSLRSEAVSGLWGGHSMAKVYLVDIEVAGRLLRGVEVLSNPKEKEILIGRDVSNHLRLLLDGPDLSTEILTDTADY